MHRQKLIEKLKNPKYRHAFSSAQARRTISAQIRALRQSSERDWTQKELGERAGMKQNAIARLENPDYGEYSVRTLQRLAEAFDVALVVKFAPFSELVNINQGARVDNYLPASFKDDTQLSEASRSQHLERPVASALSTPRETFGGTTDLPITSVMSGGSGPTSGGLVTQFTHWVSEATTGSVIPVTTGAPGTITGSSVISFMSDGSGGTQTFTGFLSSVHAAQDRSHHAD